MNLVTHGLTTRCAAAEEDGTGRGSPLVVAHALRSEGADASEDGTGRGTPLVCATLNSGGNNGGFRSEPGEHLIAFGWNKSDSQTMRVDEKTTDALQSSPQSNPAIAFRACGQNGFTPSEIAPPIAATDGGGANAPTAAGQFGVRRLTPRECERLQGFPDDFTRYDANGKEISDSARYRMLGNAVAVPVSRWIGKRIMSIS